MKQPLISVITASYNYEKDIVKAIDSVLNQSYKNWELIIVDDGSSDNSLDVIKKYAGLYENIFYFSHENNQNKGLSETIKLALSKANGEFVAFLESDDTWDEMALEKRVKALKGNPEAKFVFNDVELVGDENQISLLLPSLQLYREQYPQLQSAKYIYKYMLSFNLILTFSSWMCEKKLLETCDFNPPIKPYLDWWLWSQISTKTKIVCVNEKLTNWQLHQKSYISRTKSEISVQNLRLYRKKLLELLKVSCGERYESIAREIFAYQLENSKKALSQKEKSEYIELMKKSNVYVYGAGQYTREFLNSAESKELKIKALIDGDSAKQGQVLNTYKIYHKSEIASLNPDVILVCLAKPELVKDELDTLIKGNGLKTKLITNFFIKQKKVPCEKPLFEEIENFLIDSI